MIDKSQSTDLFRVPDSRHWYSRTYCRKEKMGIIGHTVVVEAKEDRKLF
jgi:hypothetical protein